MGFALHWIHFSLIEFEQLVSIENSINYDQRILWPLALQSANTSRGWNVLIFAEQLLNSAQLPEPDADRQKEGTRRLISSYNGRCSRLAAAAALYGGDVTRLAVEQRRRLGMAGTLVSFGYPRHLPLLAAL